MISLDRLMTWIRPGRRGGAARRALKAALALALALAAGCAPPVQPTGYLDSYTDFDLVSTGGYDMAARRSVRFRSGPAIDHFKTTETLTRQEPPAPAASAEAATTSTAAAPWDLPESQKPVAFVILPVQWKVGGETLKEKKRDELLRLTRERLYIWIGRAYPPPVYIRYEMLPDDTLLRRTRPVFLESAVTDARGGFWPTRVFLGYIIHGSAQLQLEGRLREGSPTGPVIAEFAIRVAHDGFPRMGLNYKSYSDVYCLKHAANETAYHLMRYTRRWITPPPPPPGMKTYKWD